MASPRHLQRIAVMQTIFGYEMRKTDDNADPKKMLEYTMKEFESQVSDPSFAFALLEGVMSHKEAIKEQIQKYAPKWPLDKISPIDRAILEIGIYELVFSKEVPDIVAIDEAIEIAKSYGNENSFKFVNGVLSAVMKDIKR